MTARFALAASLLAAAFASSAQVHMCKDANGRKIFSDSPCGEKSEIVDVRPATGSTAINPSTSMQYKYYEVSGLTYNEVARDIRSKGPDGGWWGSAATRMAYSITTRPGPDGCIVDTVQSSADSTVRLPQWRNRHEAPVTVQSQVDAAFRSLELHERGHVAISLKGARQLERSVREVPPGKSCGEVAAEADRRAREAIAASEREQRLYDSENNHGIEQWSPYRETRGR